MLRAADVLIGTEDGDSRFFAWTAVTLLDGRSFATVPIMHCALEARKEAWRTEEHRQWSEGDNGTNGTAALQRLVAIAEWPEGEFPVVDGAVWLDGFLRRRALASGASGGGSGFRKG